MTIYSLDELLFLLEPVCCSMSSSNCCFFRFLRRQVRRSGIPIPLRIFQFVVIHTVKGFGIVKKTEVDVILDCCSRITGGYSCFFYDIMDDGNLISGSSAFSKSSLNIWKLLVHVVLRSCLKNFEHYFASM